MQSRRADIGAVPFFQRTDTLSDTVTPHCKDPGIRHRNGLDGGKITRKMQWGSGGVVVPFLACGTSRTPSVVTIYLCIISRVSQKLAGARRPGRVAVTVWGHRTRQIYIYLLYLVSVAPLPPPSRDEINHYVLPYPATRLHSTNKTTPQHTGRGSTTDQATSTAASVDCAPHSVHARDPHRRSSTRQGRAASLEPVSFVDSASGLGSFCFTFVHGTRTVNRGNGGSIGGACDLSASRVYSMSFHGRKVRVSSDAVEHSTLFNL
eukprot:scaffold36377_cov66-Phaeocystis_antarctica.AAC.3